jgi:hypothetical protein
MRIIACVFVIAALVPLAGKAEEKQPRKETQNKSMTDDMRKAIAFERAKDRADARQGAIEARHPTVFYNQAERSADENPTGTTVRDPGPGRSR